MLHNLRCEQCNALLAKEDIALGGIEIKCSRCNKMNWFEYTAKLFESMFTATI